MFIFIIHLNNGLVNLVWMHWCCLKSCAAWLCHQIPGVYSWLLTTNRGHLCCLSFQSLPISLSLSLLVLYIYGTAHLLIYAFILFFFCCRFGYPPPNRRNNPLKTIFCIYTLCNWDRYTKNKKSFYYDFSENTFSWYYIYIMMMGRIQLTTWPPFYPVCLSSSSFLCCLSISCAIVVLILEKSLKNTLVLWKKKTVEETCLVIVQHPHGVIYVNARLKRNGNNTSSVKEIKNAMQRTRVKSFSIIPTPFILTSASLL